MIYKFRSRATGDVIMLGPHGDHFLSLLGREPAPKGILEVAHMADALQRLDAALKADADARETTSNDHDDNGGSHRHLDRGDRHHEHERFHHHERTDHQHDR